MKTSHVFYEGNLRTTCTHLKSGEKIITDAPADNQGKGEAFSPTDLTATSLLSCLITTIAIAANKNSILIYGMEGDVVKVMAPDPRRIVQIIIEVQITAPGITDEDKSYLDHVGRHCPVANSLHPDIKQDISISWI